MSPWLWSGNLSNLLHFFRTLLRVFSDVAAIGDLLLLLTTLDH